MTNSTPPDPSKRVKRLARAAFDEVFAELAQRHTIWGQWVGATGAIPGSTRPADINARVFAHVPAIVTTSMVEGVDRIELQDQQLFVVEVVAGDEYCRLAVTDGHPDDRLRYTQIVGRDDDGSALVTSKPVLLTEIEGIHVLPLIDALVDMIEVGLAEAEITEAPPSQ